MRLRDTATTALRGVTSNASRALLTMLGIIIGVGAVVLMTGIGQSMQGVILGQISSLGPETYAIMPGNEESGPQAALSSFDKLTLDDADAIAKLTTVENVSPLIFISSKVTYGREKSEPQTIAGTPVYFLNQNVEVAEGRTLNWDDEKGAKFVANLGTDTAKDLFPNGNAIGKRIEINDRKFTVVGVLKPVGSQFFQNADERIVIPLSVGKEISGQTYASMISMKGVAVSSLVISDVQSLLRQRHKIKLPDDGGTKNDDFVVRSAAQAQDILSTVTLSLTLFITMIAGVSLLVGGIGIMNIMLVAVTERTREIGLRKAVGAQRKDILMQFLIESIFLTLIGGVVGVLFGIGFSWLIALVTTPFLATYHFAISFPSIVVALAMAAGTGMVFGIYPARKASLLKPIEALRYE